jgi:hypothetical protein
MMRSTVLAELPETLKMPNWLNLKNWPAKS